MISVKVLYNGERNIIDVPETMTIQQIFDSRGIDCSDSVQSLDYRLLKSAEMGNTLEELGVTTSCVIASVKICRFLEEYYD